MLSRFRHQRLSGHSSEPRRRTSFQANVEGLEGRRLLAVDVVASLTGTNSLSYWVSKAKSGDTIEFNPALTGRTITIDSALVISKNLTITGSFELPNHITQVVPVVLKGGGKDRIFTIDGGSTKINVTLNYLTITNGNAPDAHGGGLFVHWANLTMNSCVVQGNTAAAIHPGDSAFGGGMYVQSSVVSLKYCTFSGNQAKGAEGVAGVLETNNGNGGTGGAAYGGGICVWAASGHEHTTVTLTDSKVEDNTAQGGLGGKAGPPRNSINIAVAANGGQGGDAHGGGIFAEDGTLNLRTRCTISENKALAGDGNLGGFGYFGVTPEANGGTGGTGGKGGKGSGGGLEITTTATLNSDTTTMSGNLARGGSGGLGGFGGLGAPPMATPDGVIPPGNGGNGGQGGDEGQALGGAIYITTKGSFTLGSITGNTAAEGASGPGKGGTPGPGPGAPGAAGADGHKVAPERGGIFEADASGKATSGLLTLTGSATNPNTPN
jgi:hypothetical protein